MLMYVRYLIVCVEESVDECDLWLTGEVDPLGSAGFWSSDRRHFEASD